MHTPVLHLRSSIGFFGAEAVVLALVGETAEGAWRPVVGMIRNEQDPHVELAEEAEKHGVETEIFPCRGRIDPSMIFALRRFLKERSVRILHCHGYKSNLYGLLASIGTPTRLVTTCHNWTDADWKLAVYAWLDRRVMRRFEVVVSVSEPLTAQLERQGIAGSRIVTIANGVSVERFAAAGETARLRSELGLEPGHRAIAVIGRLSPEKGQTVFLDAVAKIHGDVPEARFLLVGAGPSREELAARAEALGIASKVVFCGNRGDIERVYALAEIVVIPSLTEGLPVVLLEAMAARTPVVATRVGAIPEVVEHGQSAMLVEPDDADSLATGMRKVLDDEGLREGMAEAGSRRVRKAYSSRAMAKRYEEVYERLTASRAARGSVSESRAL